MMKIIYKLIPSSVFGDAPIRVNSDGSVTLQYSDVGESTKFFIGSKQYFKFLLDEYRNNPPKNLSSFVTKNLLNAIEKFIK